MQAAIDGVKVRPIIPAFHLPSRPSRTTRPVKPAAAPRNSRGPA